MKYLRQGTAATLTVGPFVGTDGVTANTALTSQTGRIAKNGTGASLTPSSWAHDADGHYAVGLSTDHTDTAGRLRISFAAASCLPVWEDYTVLYPDVYDWLLGTSAPCTGTAADIAQTLLSTAAAGFLPGTIGQKISTVVTTGALPTNFSNLAITSGGGVTLAPGGLDVVEVEDGVNARQALAALGAALAGKYVRAGSTETFYAMGDPDTVRIVATVSAAGRTSVTLTLPS